MKIERKTETKTRRLKHAGKHTHKYAKTHTHRHARAHIHRDTHARKHTHKHAYTHGHAWALRGVLPAASPWKKRPNTNKHTAHTQGNLGCGISLTVISITIEPVEGLRKTKGRQMKGTQKILRVAIKKIDKISFHQNLELPPVPPLVLCCGFGFSSSNNHKKKTCFSGPPVSFAASYPTIVYGTVMSSFLLYSGILFRVPGCFLR